MEQKQSKRFLLTTQQKQKIKKYGVYSALGVMFVCAMVILFFPKDKDGERKLLGFNTEIPDPNNEDMVSDKLSAYEKGKLDFKAEERKRMMMDIGSYMNNHPEEAKEEKLDLLNPEVEQEPKRSYRGGGGGSIKPKETIYASSNAYRDMNTTLGNFYETPKVDPEKEQMGAEIEELKAQLQAQQPTQADYGDQVALLEKSYELAAKYMPNSSAQPPTVDAKQDERPQLELVKNGKNIAMPISQVSKNVVSALYQELSDSAFMAEYSQPRNTTFNSAVGAETTVEVNTIKVCIHEDKTVTDGQSVRLRLLEPMRAGKHIIPKQTLITGMGKIQGERLSIAITTLEYQGMIIPVELTIYDSDGQEGIFIPNSMEVSAIKEVAANMGSSLGSSINISTDAGAQLASDLGKGVIQGASQYIANKMRVVKVHLKAGYKLMLYQDKQ